ncbi:MAG: TerB family tellurite resistance protein [Deltaproteobacteria bacterium]|nr:TerB family tellurite resistance protein [Deltaproteobacteria bacterium]
MLRLRIQPLNTDQVLLYLKLLSGVAAADGEVSEAERAMFEATMADYGLPDDARRQVRSCLDAPPSIDGELRRLEDGPVRRLFLRDAWLMAYMDGRVSDPERERLESVRRALRLPESEAAAAEGWVREGLAWIERGDEMVGTLAPHRRSMF